MSFFSQSLSKEMITSPHFFTLAKYAMYFAGALLAVSFLLGLSPLSDAPLLLFVLAGGGGGGGESGGGDGGDGNRSTPFICTWDGEGYVFENDFLFGKPGSAFATNEIGKREYEGKRVTPDLYKMQNAINDAELKFQIKEIEPEESFIDHIRLKRVVHSENIELFPSASFKDVFGFDQSAIRQADGIEGMLIRKGANDEEITDVLKVDAENSIRLETGEYITIEAKVNSDKPIYLLLGSLYRDWTLGEIPRVRDSVYTKMQNNFRELIATPLEILSHPSKIVKTGGFALAFIFVWGLSFIIPTQNDRTQDESLLAKKFGVPTAHADTPTRDGHGHGDDDGGRSLNVEYWDGSRFNVIDVIEPRYYQASVTAVPIPEDAVYDGKILIRIQATKRHDVHSVRLIAAKADEKHKTETLVVKKAIHIREKKDYSGVLNAPFSGEYLHTIPGDTVDIEFTEPRESARKEEKTTYFLEAGGYYTPLSFTSAKESGDWFNRLDDESREWLKSMYALNNYHNKDRQPVLRK